MIMLGGCFSSKSTSIIEFMHDVDVQIGSKASEHHPEGDNIEISDTPILISAKGHDSLYLVPHTNSPKSIQIRLKPSVKVDLEEKLDDAFFKINEVFSLMSTGKNKEAIAKITVLEQTYQEVTYFRFLKASCLILNKEFAKAKTILEELNRFYPENIQINELYETILNLQTTR